MNSFRCCLSIAKGRKVTPQLLDMWLSDSSSSLFAPAFLPILFQAPAWHLYFEARKPQAHTWEQTQYAPEEMMKANTEKLLLWWDHMTANTSGGLPCTRHLFFFNPYNSPHLPHISLSLLPLFQIDLLAMFQTFSEHSNFCTCYFLQLESVFTLTPLTKLLLGF